jgi:sulfane dehydrogenase subunit SoxC
VTKPGSENESAEIVAGNGLLHRRLFLARGGAMLGAGSLGLLTPLPVAAQYPPSIPLWSKSPGAGMSGYGKSSSFEDGVQRTLISAPGTTGSGGSRTPIESLEGMITPAPLHFERHHSGIPAIDPDQHQLLIHGLVDRPLKFTMEALSRYPMESRIQFLECSGNSRANLGAEPMAGTCGDLHGLISCSEWTGVPLSLLLDEVGVKPEGSWIVAEGADSALMSRSVPMAKALDDALVAIYQNGERLHPANGYPVRLFLPGYEGNISVKWLRRLKVTSGPGMTKDETSKYTDTQPDGSSRMFTFPMDVKSVITAPSAGRSMQGPGLYEISGIAWSGSGKVSRVEVSADGGQTWGEAALSEPVLSMAITRFRMAWHWDGGPANIMSRAIDETGVVQPSRQQFMSARGGAKWTYHYNGIQVWHVAANGGVSNVHA